MRRDVSAHLELSVAGPATLLFDTEVAMPGADVEDEVLVTVDGRPVATSVVPAPNDARIRELVLSGAATVVYDYRATVVGTADPAPGNRFDEVVHLRPSRYAESDALAPTALAEFAGLDGDDLLAAVAAWVHDRLAYVTGSSLPTDGAVRTLLARQGVCRDFAHLTVALLRARDVPARLVSVYAPGLDPMDFHAVCEAWVGDQWHLVDATWLAPRSSLVRIATGRDAADTAFLTSHGADVILDAMAVSAVADELPTDDWTSFVQLT